MNLPITVWLSWRLSFISGGFENDAQLRQIALSRFNSIVICIHTAPGTCYPAAHDDGARCTLVLRSKRTSMVGDLGEHLVFIGDSAGGQLALATTLRLKVRPVVVTSANSYLPNADPTGTRKAAMVKMVIDYIITANMLLLVSSYTRIRTKKLLNQSLTFKQ
ncbi:alpha/beta hydrolase [Vibrio chagasii]|nr:alpha/beta hydrolase [Vibrio chagasii]